LKAHNLIVLFFLLAESLALASGLPHKESINRAKQVSKVSYALNIDLTKPRTYSGNVSISFQFKRGLGPLRIDFQAGTILGLRLNDKTAKYAYNQHFIEIPESGLKNGANILSVSYRHSYSRNGSGLYRFEDPIDQRVYVYTDFEPFDANQLMPSFDQPDLKATYEITAKAPKNWVVISATRETRVEDQEDTKTRVWHFPKTLPFSTYLISLHAGPYHQWQSPDSKIPLRLFARKSLAKYVDQDFWFKITTQGFDFFNNFFKTAYPFKKYDQVIVPDFNSGAMENVAAVTFSERYIQRGVTSANEQRKLASVILHEMAHMWFGNLVTMQWWDDLWLNESFATLMSSYAMASATEFTDEWLRFNSTMKNWAYLQDSLVTTHPIMTQIDSTDKAFAHFDGITYGKGAATLKQLYFKIGRRAFQEGLARYFKQHAFQNTTLDDFIAAMSEASQQPLTSFKESWLTRAGLNELKISWTCKEGSLDTITMHQSATKANPTLRNHKMVIGLFHLDNGDIEREQLTLTYKGPKTLIKGPSASKCPTIILGNTRDMDYVKLVFDEKSLKVLQDNYEKFKDPMIRSLIWQSQNFMVRDGRLPLTTMWSSLTSAILIERNPIVLEAMHSRMRYLKTMIIKAAGAKQRQRLIQPMADAYWGLIHTANSSKDRKPLIAAYAELIYNQKDIDRIVSLLNKKEMSLSQDLRWSIIQKLANLGQPQASILAEVEQDPSARGEKARIGIEAALAPTTAKKLLINNIVTGRDKRSASIRSVIFNSVIPLSQNKAKQIYQKQFVKDLGYIIAVAEPNVAAAFVKHLSPSTCNESDSKVYQQALSVKPLPAKIKKSLLESQEENTLCIRIKQNLTL